MKAYALFLLAFPCALSCAIADVESDLPLGIEALTGYHSHSVYRGLELSEEALDFQLSTEVALNNDWLVGISGWHIASSSDDFTETSGELSLIYRSDSDWTFTTGITQRSFDHPIVESGTEVFADLSYEFSIDFSAAARLSYDDASGSALGELSIHYSRVINDSAWWAIEAGTLLADDFYGASGLASANARLSATYLINSQLSITPYLAHSEQIDDAFGEESVTSAGVWFAISF